MPLDADHAWTPDQVLTGAEIRAAIDAVYPLEPEPREPQRDRPRLPVRRRPGQDRLHQPGVRAVLRRLQPDPPDRRRPPAHVPVLAERDRPARPAARRRRRRELEQIIRDAVWRKELKHHVGEPGFIQPARTMSRDRRLERLRNSFARHHLGTQMLLLMLFALIAGAGTAITPCVLPVAARRSCRRARSAAGAGRSGS